MPRDFSDPNVARRAAQFLVTAGFDTSKAGKLMDPSSTNPSSLGRKMAASLEVQEQMRLILNRTERNAAKFSDLMWDWLQADTNGDKDASENKRTAARILAKGYISEKGPREADSKPALVIQASSTEIGNLTESVDSKKVM